MGSKLYGRHVLALSDLSPSDVSLVLDYALKIKADAKNGIHAGNLKNKAIAVILQKPSLRTRVSFEVAIARLGAHPVIMSGPDGAFSRGESVTDTIKVLERYVDAVVIRTFSDEMLQELSENSAVPIINALTDGHHPCQGLADLLTLVEKFGTLSGLKITYVGDGSNNMAHTYLDAGALTGMHVTIATPPNYLPDPAILANAEAIARTTGGSVAVTDDAVAAVTGADIVITDTWASMGQEDEHAVRASTFAPYQVNDDLMSHAAPTAVFMHCLPAHRGEEVTNAVMDGPQSIIFDEAENRLFAQQALLALVLDPHIEE